MAIAQQIANVTPHCRAIFRSRHSSQVVADDPRFFAACSKKSQMDRRQKICCDCGATRRRRRSTRAPHVADVAPHARTRRGCCSTVAARTSGSVGCCDVLRLIRLAAGGRGDALRVYMNEVWSHSRQSHSSQHPRIFFLCVFFTSVDLRHAQDAPQACQEGEEAFNVFC